MHEYSLKNIRVVSGSSLEADIALGFNIIFRRIIRLAGVDTPEPRGETREEGEIVAAWLRHFLKEEPDKEIILLSKKDTTGKYGRILGEIKVYIHDGDEHGDFVKVENVNHLMVSRGLAKRVEY